MNTYRFEWEAMVTPELVGRVARVAGVSPADAEQGRAALARILAAAGGLPVVHGLPNAAERTAFGLQLLHDAVRHTLAAAVAGERPARRSEGYALDQSRIAALGSTARAIERVSVNSASASSLATSTGSSASLCEKIVEERRARGPFASVEELDRRVNGVDVRNRERIGGAVLFDQPEDLLAAQSAIKNDFETDLTRLFALNKRATSLSTLSETLELVAALCAREPHPATVGQRVRSKPPAVVPPATAVDWVGVLPNEDYYTALPKLFAGAVRTLDVCMFHIAAPGDNHPTRRLLDALIAAQARGVAVRVLVDRDREADPYLSTVINTPAKKLLEAAGVPVRFDAAARLLHSKFLVIDQTTVVMGSHNWSAGSFFGFDDLTLVLASAQLSLELTQRFEKLWNLT